MCNVVQRRRIAGFRKAGRLTCTARLSVDRSLVRQPPNRTLPVGRPFLLHLGVLRCLPACSSSLLESPAAALRCLHETGFPIALTNGAHARVWTETPESSSDPRTKGDTTEDPSRSRLHSKPKEDLTASSPPAPAGQNHCAHCPLERIQAIPIDQRAAGDTTFPVRRIAAQSFASMHSWFVDRHPSCSRFGHNATAHPASTSYFLPT